MRDERDGRDVRGRANRDVHGPAARLSASLDVGGCEAAPFAGDDSVDRQGVEGGFDHSEALGAAPALAGIDGDENAKCSSAIDAALIARSGSG